MSESTTTHVPSTVETHPTYEVFHVIGQGASSTIHDGFDWKFDRPVAIKQLRGDASAAAAEAFKDEARFLSGLSHPNIVHVYDYDPSRGWIVMERMKCSLAEQLEQGPLAAEKVRDILRQALEGLQFLHGKNKLHGEIKPGNLLIDESGVVKLCDTAGVELDGEFRRPDDSLRHVAPEVLNPEEFGTPGSGVDLYCVGLVALELLTGAKFSSFFKGVAKSSGNESLAWAQWHASPTEKLPPVNRIARNVPAELAAVIDRLLKKHVRDRYSSAAEAIADLTSSADVRGTEPAMVPAVDVSRGETRRSVQVTRAPSLHGRGAAEQKVAEQDPLATWKQRLHKLYSPENRATRRRVLILAGAAVGLLLCVLASGGPTTTPPATVRILTISDDGEQVEATISIDGEPTGRSGEPIEIAPGRYEVTAKPTAGSRFESTTTTLELTAGEASPKIVLQRRKVEARPKSVTIVVSPRSESPLSDTLEPTLWIDELKCAVGQQEFNLNTGEHQLRVELEGHMPYEERILVSTEQTTFKPTLKQLRRTVSLLIEPPTAQVFLAGEPLTGSAPYEIVRPDGDYKVFVSCPEYEPKEELLSIRGDGTHRMTLNRTPRFSIRFETEPANATLYVGEAKLGPTPNRFALPAGRHQVVLNKPGYAPVKSWIHVDASSDFFFWYLQTSDTPTAP